MMRRSIAIISLLIALCFTVSAEVLQRPVTYRSVDRHGDSLTVSGLIMVPQDTTPKGIILLPHFTIFTNDHAPSNRPTHDAVALSDRYVILQPDYVGYGVTVDSVHPYLHGELAARNTLDLYLQMLPVLDSLAPGLPLDSIYIVGYSQGAASALWTLRLIEQHYAHQIHVIHCFVGDGPYDVAATYDECLLHKRFAMPMLIPLLVMGTSAAYDLDLQQDYFFRPPMKRAYAKWLEPKCHDPFKIYFRMLNHRLSHWLTPQALDKSLPQTQRLYAGLLQSSMVHFPIIEGDTDTVIPSWTPVTPMYIFHSTNDDIVSLRCSQHLQRCFGSLPHISWDFDEYGTHMQASRVFVGKVKSML